jgi:hypothetical protein
MKMSTTWSHSITPTQSPPSVAKFAQRRYGSPVVANSATRVWRPSKEIDAQASYPKADAFFMSTISCYGGCAWETFGSAGFQFPRFANLRTAATHNRLATTRGSSKNEIGAVPMQFSPTQDPSVLIGKTRAHRAMAMAMAMAMAALRADSSLSVRLKRYNAHMAIVRALELQGGAN